MQFIFGVIFGRLLASGESVLLMSIALPFAMALFALVGWGGYEAIIWFDASAANYVAANWYAWPWNWPGAHFAKMGCEFFYTNFFGGIIQEPLFDVDPIGWFFSLPYKSARASLAISTNVIIAFLPVYLLSELIKFLRLKFLRKSHSPV
jgi:hypothetical protein